MGKHRFLEVLEERLSEELPRSLVINHLQYYESYIEDAVRNGKKEAEVMDELGDPVMIAHTIINTETGESFQGYAEDAVFTEIVSEDSEESKKNRTEEQVEYIHLNTDDDSSGSEENVTISKVISKNSCLLTALMIVLILFIVLSVLGVLLPILLPILAVGLIFVMIFGKNR